MANEVSPLRRAVRAALRYYRFRALRAEEREKLAHHNQALGLRVSWKDVCHARRAFGCSVDEYFHFDFFHKSDAERDAYLTQLRQDEIASSVGDDCRPLTIPGNKVLFHMLFGEYLRREWCNPSACTEAEFVAFVERRGTVMVKPPDLCKGLGIYKFSHESAEKTAALYRELRGHGGLVEEVLVQHPEMDRINPHLINTIRVATYTDADDVHIVAAAMRTSTRADRCTDNLHNGGCACAVDVETGVVISNGFTSKMERFENHPLTGTPFIGFQIPCWDEALRLLRTVARKAYALPQCHWLGWDLAIVPDGVALVEGNWRQAVDLIQYGRPGFYHQLVALSKKQ